jgi:pimeloyl-ACP methyl ester carboxylesterase
MRESILPTSIDADGGKSAVISRIVHYASHLARNGMPPSPWWDNLDPQFAARDEHFKLRTWDRVRVDGTAAIDVVVRTAAAGLIGATAVPLGFHPKMLEQMIEDMPFYHAIADKRDPTAFFDEPPRRIHVRTRPAKGAFFMPHLGTCEDITFKSPYVPKLPRLREEHEKLGKTNIAHARFFRHEGGPRPTIIIVHGFMADLYALNEWFFALKWFYDMGCNVVLFTLPFHGHRQPRFSPFSGHGFFAGGLSRVNEAFGQGIMDMRVLMNWLEDRHEITSIGVTGISLGGYTSALAASVDKRLAFSIPNVPVVSISDLVLEWEPIGTLMRAAMKLGGIPLEKVRHTIAPVTPLTYDPVLPKHRLMIIGGAGDRLAPPKHSRLLWDHWKRPRMHWYPGSHLIHLDQGAYLKHMARFMTDIGFLDRPEALPSRISSQTYR